MGAPKQKWTAEEEAALKAGVIKHGAGKWRTILKDPEFSSILYLRSNVDLKDKWRNLSVMANGLGSREKLKVASKRVQLASHQDDNSASASELPLTDEELDAHPASSSSPTPQIPASKRSIVRLDNLILEAITNLGEDGGSSKTAIASYIEDQYWAPPQFKKLLSAKLKLLVSNGKLIRDEGYYSIVPPPLSSDRRKTLSVVDREMRQFTTPKVERGEVPLFTRSQIDSELAKMRTMTAKEAAAAAALAVAEAELAIAEAEEAAREAEAAEADAVAAQALVEAAMKTPRGRSTPKTGHSFAMMQI
ncbi:Telomere repeat-binding factor 1-like protein [Drosera capensis]